MEGGFKGKWGGGEEEEWEEDFVEHVGRDGEADTRSSKGV